MLWHSWSLYRDGKPSVRYIGALKFYSGLMGILCYSSKKNNIFFGKIKKKYTKKDINKDNNDSGHIPFSMR